MTTNGATRTSASKWSASFRSNSLRHQTKKAPAGAFFMAQHAAAHRLERFMQMSLMFKKLNEQVVSVHLGNGELVGQLKLIGGVWKFKAVGYTAEGRVVPGGGPLTDRHNMTFAVLNEAAVNIGLMGR
jgi:hypothetical protein